MHQFICAHHHSANVRDTCTVRDVKVFLEEAVQTFVEEKLKELKEKFSSKAQVYVGRVPKNQQ